MARNTRKAATHAGDGPISEDAAANAGADFGLDASRTLVSQNLDAAQTWLTQMEQLQRARLHALDAWVKLFSAAHHEAEHATDMRSLMSLSAKLVNSQWTLVMEQFGAQLSMWLESQMRVAEQMREAGTELNRRVMPDMPPATRTHNGAATEPLSQLGGLGHLQDQWLAATQRWIDVAKSAQPH
jgi:hypothetical protein